MRHENDMCNEVRKNTVPITEIYRLYGDTLERKTAVWFGGAKSLCRPKKRAAHTTALLNSNFLTRCCNFEAEHDRSDSGSPTYQKSTRHVDFWRQQDLFFRRTYRTVRITAPFGPAADINPHGIKTGDLHGEVIATGGHTRTARIHDGLPIATR